MEMNILAYSVIELADKNLEALHDLPVPINELINVPDSVESKVFAIEQFVMDLFKGFIRFIVTGE